jgi:hypothetical protein
MYSTTVKQSMTEANSCVASDCCSQEGKTTRSVSCLSYASGTGVLKLSRSPKEDYCHTLSNETLSTSNPRKVISR